MNSNFDNVADFMVIGGGIAGLFFALKAAKNGKVILLAKTEIIKSNTYYAQGGIAAVAKSTDTYENHISDTLKAGDELCDQKTVEIVVKTGPEVIEDLISEGVRFTKDGENESGFSLHKEGGHSEHRIYHYTDVTGKEIIRGLSERIFNHPNITVLEHHLAIDLLTEHQKDETLPVERCYGAYVLDLKKNRIRKFLSRNTILATGGSGQVYKYTSNPEVATGDGIAMAYRAKASIANMEFFQFHPTTLYTERKLNQSFLISEAVRGFGGILKNSAGEEFMDKYHELKSLAPRDIVARSIDREMKHLGDENVYLDVTSFPAKKIMSSFPNIYERCLMEGIDISKEMIPVVPAAHYQCGGIKTDLRGRTDLKGLYAIGEVAFTGIHGANRLASNSLLEALVFAKNAALDSGKNVNKMIEFTGFPEWESSQTKVPQELIVIKYLKKSIQTLMTSFVGIVRSDERLEFAIQYIDVLLRQTRKYYKKTVISKELIELRNLADTASLIIRSALLRKESRGLHYNIDYPEKDNEKWQKPTIIKSKNKSKK